MRRHTLMLCGCLAVAPIVVTAAPPHRSDPAALIKAEATALAPLARMDGVWRGSASVIAPNGKHQFTQTERVGSFLHGSIKVMEGRGYEADGSVSFNALGIMSYDPRSKAYTMHSYAEGYVGDFTLKLTADGFSWDVSAGPTTMRYTATIRNGTWHEVGQRIVAAKSPVQSFEMTLKRVGNTDWPAAGAVPFKP